MRKYNVNTDIAFTHIFTRKRQTIVAALGVTIGIAIFLFMNSLSAGFSEYSRKEIFKSSAHIKVYREDEISTPLDKAPAGQEVVIVNPQITTISKTLLDPKRLMDIVRDNSTITTTLTQVNADVFYKNGSSQLKGTANGVDIMAANAIFNIQSYIIAGSLKDLQENLNGIIIGKGIAEKLNVQLNDNITVSSSHNVIKTLKVKGIFSSGNSFTDQSKSYVNISTAQQLEQQGPSYITTIYANTENPDNAPKVAEVLQQNLPYKVEPWQVTNADVLSGDVVRKSMMTAITLSILLVATFGIYNILNMTVMQKINDIAILKATGFSRGDVVQIFVTEALIMGLIGCIAGMGFASVLIVVMKNTWMGPPVGYFPINFDANIFLSSFALGLFLTLAAGYIPARRAARVDPVEIFRK